MRRLVACLAVTAILLFPGAVSAAGPSPTPNGFCGAMNMLNDATMATIPMVRNNPDGDIFLGHGNAGMWLAVGVSDCRS